MRPLVTLRDRGCCSSSNRGSSSPVLGGRARNRLCRGFRGWVTRRIRQIPRYRDEAVAGSGVTGEAPWRQRPAAAGEGTRPGACGAGGTACAWCPRPRHRQAAERSRRRQAGARARVRVRATRLWSPIPTIPRCGRRPRPPRAASAPGTAALVAARAPGCQGDDLKRLAYPYCAPASILRHRRTIVPPRMLETPGTPRREVPRGNR
jgi:hypothetical protein